MTAIRQVLVGVCSGLVIVSAWLASPAHAQVCGDGAIASAEDCDDGNTMDGDGCSGACTVEAGFACVPSLHASGVNPAGVALPAGSLNPHWTWSTAMDGSGAMPGYVARNGAWASLPPGNWITTDAAFGASLTTEPDTYWFQDVFMPATFAGTLTFPVAVAADNECEVFVNGVSFGTAVGFGTATSISVPATAFVAGRNTVTIRLREYIPGTPRGILMYPGGGGILSQCTRTCAADTDCDDTNDCTDDTCVAGACLHAPAATGSTCATGVCSEPLPVSTCVACLDDAMATDVDTGCTTAAPICDTAGAGPTCVECTAATDCAAGLDCVAGACVVPEVDGGVIEVDGGPMDEDGGTTDIDGGASNDGGPSPVDAGRADGGGGGGDAGGRADGGGGTTSTDGGCGCVVARERSRAWPLAIAFGGLLVAGARLRRRARRGAPRR